MDLGLDGKIALVTASSGGMGANIARALAGEGASIVLFARSAGKLDELAAEIAQQHGVTVLPVAGSMDEPADIERLTAAIDQTFGRLDIAVLNSGRPPSPLRATREETDRERWDQSYRTLLAGVIAVTQAVLPLLERSSAGRIVAVTSAAVHRPMPHHALSAVFRAAVESFMRHLAPEVASARITVNCVAPALIETPHRQGAAAYTPEQTVARKRMNMLARLGTQDELCALVAFLTSSQAGFLTGVTVPIDGGLMPRF
jgi:3-oxoacyl-[acyl-carrier protein] reductase